MEIDRPLPNPMTPEAKPYWDGLREQKLMLPKCGAGGHVFWYPRVACPRCHTRNIGWIQSKGRGTLYAFEIGYQSFNKAFKVPAPYVLAMVDLRDLSNVACIVGVDESDEMGTLPGKSQLSLHVEAVTNAVRDAGLKVSDIDGVFTAGQHSPATIGEALGITARHVDGTTVGGCSFIIMVGHAAAALHHGLC